MTGPSRGRWSGLGVVALIAFFGVFLGFVVWAFTRLWEMAGPDTHMSIHGWIAMALAGLGTLGLGCGLMWLAFYSSRKGYDERGRRDGPTS